MKTKSIITTLSLCLFISPVFAHDGVKHEGKPVEGKVTSFSGMKMDVATDKGPIEVTFEPNTKFELGMKGEKGKKSDIEQGDFVIVEGTKLSSKEVSATEVMIHKDESQSDNQGEAK